MAQNGIQYWGLSWTVLLVIMYLSMGQAHLTTNCMKCICEVEGCENNLYACNPDEGSLSCGPYQIKRPYYTDCKRPGMINNYQGCTKTMKCSETCVEAYMQRYGLYCTRGDTPTCENYARIHNGGPTGCRHHSDSKTEAKLRTYWEKVKQCCDSRNGGC